MTAEGFEQNVRYIKNPDVVLREEDQSGALLFNPDTNQVLVVNGTGLFLWRLSDGTRSADQMVDAVRGEFEAVPEGSVASQVKGFLDEMAAGGFLGVDHS